MTFAKIKDSIRDLKNKDIKHFLDKNKDMITDIGKINYIELSYYNNLEEQFNFVESIDKETYDLEKLVKKLRDVQEEYHGSWKIEIGYNTEDDEEAFHWFEIGDIYFDYELF
jgi:hypothetical protein